MISQPSDSFFSLFRNLSKCFCILSSLKTKWENMVFQLLLTQQLEGCLDDKSLSLSAWVKNLSLFLCHHLFWKLQILISNKNASLPLRMISQPSDSFLLFCNLSRSLNDVFYFVSWVILKQNGMSWEEKRSRTSLVMWLRPFIFRLSASG